MLSRAITVAICVCAATFPLSPVLAQTSTVTGGLDIRLQVNASCTVSGATSSGISGAVLDFGTTSLLLEAINQTIDGGAGSALTVTCNPGVEWEAAFDAGLNAGGEVANRAMALSSDPATLVRYQLYTTAARNAVLTTATGTGTGTAQTINVYGQVPVQAAPPAGSYSDTVTVTVTF